MANIWMGDHDTLQDGGSGGILVLSEMFSSL
jgi:hypothetical protein